MRVLISLTAAIKRIAQLYAVEKEARGAPPERRVQLRQVKAKPILDDLESWLQSELPKLSGKTPLANAIRYALTRIADHKINRIDELLPWNYQG